MVALPFISARRHCGRSAHRRTPSPPGDDADQQPGRWVSGVSVMLPPNSPGHQWDTQRQTQRCLPAKALHVGACGLLLALAAFGFILNHFGAVAGFSTAATSACASAAPVTSALRSAG